MRPDHARSVEEVLDRHSAGSGARRRGPLAAVNDVDVAFVTISFALPAGLTSEQAILIESESSHYFNVLATTPALKDDPRIVKLYELLTSPEVAQFEQDTWGGLVVPVTQ